MPIARILRMLHMFSRRIWVRASLYAFAGLLGALAALVLRRWIPDDFAEFIDAEALSDVLKVVASSMLAVATFSLGVVVTGYNTAASSATPRATRLLVEDPATQSMLSTFVGAFLYSVVGIVMLKTGLYGGSGRVVLFVMTVLVIFLITFTLLRWIGQLSTFGRMRDTLERVETEAAGAMARRAERPFLGCRPILDGETPPKAAQPVCIDRFSYIQHIDLAALEAAARAFGGAVWLAAQPGDLTGPGTPWCRVVGFDPDEQTIERLNATLTCDTWRSFDQDPRFGLTVMAEAAARALSPAVNDPGTAILAITRQLRALTLWTRRAEAPTRPRYPNLRAPGLSCDGLLEDAFGLIARDGANRIEVAEHLLLALQMLERLDDAEMAGAARAFSECARRRFGAALTSPDDLARLDAASAEERRQA